MVADPVTAPALPGRFRGAPERNARIARDLGRVARVRAVDEALLAELGRRMTTRDEVGATLAAAMDRHAPERVTMGQLRRALDGDLTDAPAPLRTFMATVGTTPEWVDHALIDRGARAMRRMARPMSDALLGLSLIGGYRFGGPADLLVATGHLTGERAIPRLGETATWHKALSAPGGLRPGGEGFRLSVHVRVMHALVNRAYERNGRWDVAYWGLPINQSDVAATQGLFNSTGLLGVRMLGWVVTPAESRAVMHLWRYVGWLMGVDEDWLFDTERAQNHFNYHVLLAQDGQSPAGPALARPLVDGQRRLPGGEYRRRRLLSLLRWFLGAEGLRDLGLPVTRPWALLPTVARNLVASGLVARTPAGRRYLERAGGRFLERDVAAHFPPRRAAGVASLPITRD